jgi:GlcNAc-P-P-Und epimerase
VDLGDDERAAEVLMSGLVVLVGGSGFIGTNMVPLCLAAGYRVRIVDIAPSKAFPELHVAADVRDVGQLREACEGAEVIVNLAAEHRDDVRPLAKYHEVNVLGGRNVCAVATALDVRRVVFTSSVAVYGHQTGEPDEQYPHLPVNEYGRTKSLAEKEYLDWHRAAPGRNLAIIRPTVVFGIGNRGNVYTLLSQVANPMFVMVGSGRNRKAMAYVENVAAFLLHAMKLDGLVLANYVDTPSLQMRELVTLVRRKLGKADGLGPVMPASIAWLLGAMFDAVAGISGRRFPISRIRVEKFRSETVFAARKVRDLGFSPPFALLDALNKTIEAEFRCRPQ